MLVANSRDSKEMAALKMLSSHIQTRPLLKLMKQYELRNKFYHHVISEINNTEGKAIKCLYLVCQYYFNKSSVQKENPIPKYAGTRVVIVKIVENDGISSLHSDCDCGYNQREKHACRHHQCIVNKQPTEEVFHPSLWKSYFNHMHVCNKYTKMVQEHDIMRASCKGILTKINNKNW